MKKQLHFWQSREKSRDCFYENKKGYFNKALTFMIIFR